MQNRKIKQYRYRKNRRYGRIFGLVLALMTAAGLCACGKNGQNTNSAEQGQEILTGSAGSAAAENADPRSALAKEHVYRINSKEILPWADCEDAYLGVQSAICADEGICAVLELRDWLAENVYYALLTADGTLSGMQITPLELPEAAQSAPADGEDAEEAYEEINYSNFTIAPDQRVYVLRSVTRFREDEVTGEYNEERSFEICSFDTSGKLLWISELTDLESDAQNQPNFRVRGIYAAADGSADLLYSAEQEYKIPIGREGKISDRETLSEQAQKMFADFSHREIRKKDLLQVLFPDEQDGETAYLIDYDVSKDAWGEPYALPIPYTWFSWGILQSVCAGTGSDLMYTTEDGIWTYQKGDDQGTFRMDFINSDIDVTSLDALLELDDRRFIAIYRESGASALQLGVFTYVNPEDIAEKQVVVLGGSNNDIDDLLRQRVVAFNRASDAYRIVLKKYDYDENSHSFLQLQLDIAAGNMPDILLVAELPVESLVAKGLAADICPLIKQDPELAQKEFMENVFDAYSVDGKLPYVVPDFAVATMVAKTSLVGDGSDWSAERAAQVLAGMGKDARYMSELTREEFLEKAMLYGGKNFVDMAAGKCAFDSKEFIALMELAAALPQEADSDPMDGGDYWEEYEAQYRDNRTLLMELQINKLLSSLNYELNGYMGEAYTFVGFPGISESAVGSAKEADGAAKGAYLYSDHRMMLSANSAVPEGAWAFARYYLTDDYQRSLVWSLPVDKKIWC